MIVVKVSDLHNIFNRIINKLNAEEINEIEIDTDNYLIITTDEWENFSKEPSPAVGSLVDDWKSLSKLSNPERPTTYTDFDRLASILRAISQRINPI